MLNISRQNRLLRYNSTRSIAIKFNRLTNLGGTALIRPIELGRIFLLSENHPLDGWFKRGYADEC